MARLPQPGADQGQWGDILNDYLSQAHTSAGAIKDGSITEAQLDAAVQAKLNSGGGGAVTSVNGQTGVVTLTKADIGLANIDNTSDSNKPVSVATQTALDGKVNIADLVTLTDRGAWTPSTTYDEGDIVTYQYARWYRKTTGSGGASFTASEWIHLGLYAIGATGDPGGGMLWIDVS